MLKCIKSPSARNNILDPSLDYLGAKIKIKFNGNCLKQDKITFNHGKTVNIYIVYEINKNYLISSYPTLGRCLFGAVKLTKHIDIDEYKNSRYDIGFDRKRNFSVGNGFCRNCITFGAVMSSSVHVDNKKEDILILGEGHAPGSDGTILTAEKSVQSILGLRYNRINSYLFVNGMEIIKFKAKDSEIVTIPLCLGNILKDYSVNNMKNTG